MEIATGSHDGADRVRDSLKSAFDREDYYEAHQIYKSLNFRLLRQKKFQPLSDVLYDGAIQFFHLGLDQSGIDLARMFGDLLDKGDLPVTSDLIGKAADLYRGIPTKLENERNFFLNLVMTWSKKRNPETKAGHIALHAAIAQILLEDGNLDGAVYHYVRALDPVRCLSTLQLIPENSVVAEVEEMEVDRIDGAGTTISQEPESQLTLGLAVLDFLTLQRLDLAKQLFIDFVSQHKDPEVRSKCYNFRILALVSALLSLCAKGENVTADEYGPLQATVCEIYKKNSRVEKLMTRIGQIYCNIKQASASPFAGLLAGMFKKEGATAASDPSTVDSKKINLNPDFDFD